MEAQAPISGLSQGHFPQLGLLSDPGRELPWCGTEGVRAVWQVPAGMCRPRSRTLRCSKQGARVRTLRPLFLLKAGRMMQGGECSGPRGGSCRH